MKSPMGMLNIKYGLTTLFGCSKLIFLLDAEALLCDVSTVNYLIIYYILYLSFFFTLGLYSFSLFPFTCVTLSANLMSVNEQPEIKKYFTFQKFFFMKKT